MKTRAQVIDPKTSRRRWLAASLMFLSLAALLALQPATASRSTDGAAPGKSPPLPRSVEPAPAAPQADAALQRLIALHHRATRLAPPPAPSSSH